MDIGTDAGGQPRPFVSINISPVLVVTARADGDVEIEDTWGPGSDPDRVVLEPRDLEPMIQALQFILEQRAIHARK
jgi:hypothetical protein